MKSGADGIFHDIQEFEEVSASFALTSNLLQVDKGVPTIRHDCIDLGDLMLRRLQISHTMIDGFRIRDGSTIFVFTPPVGANALWNGVQGLPDAVGIVRSGMDHEVLMPAGWSTIEVDVADHLIDSEGLLPALVESNPSAEELHSHANDVGHPDMFDCNAWCIGKGASKGACAVAAAPPCEQSAICQCD